MVRNVYFLHCIQFNHRLLDVARPVEVAPELLQANIFTAAAGDNDPGRSILLVSVMLGAGTGTPGATV